MIKANFRVGIRTSAHLKMLLLLLSVLVVATVLWAEHILGYQPCVLCLYQRVPWYVMLGFLTVRGWSDDWPISDCAVMLFFMGVSVCLSAYHFGLEIGVVPSPPLCSLPIGDSVDLTDLLQRDPVDCRRVSWRLLGIFSAALANLITSLTAVVLIVLVGMTGVACKRHRSPS